MIKIKVRGGTAKSDDDMCGTCRQCIQINGRRYCSALDSGLNGPEPIKERVYTCSAYDDKRLPRLHELEDIAWRIVTKKAGRGAGFVSPKEYKKTYKKTEEGED